MTPPTSNIAGKGYKKSAYNPTDGALPMADAVVLAEGCLDEKKGKTAHGLVRQSMRDEIRTVIDSTHAGEDAARVIGDEPAGIPVVRDLEAALEHGDPEVLYLGASPVGGDLPEAFVETLTGAIERGMTVFNGGHSFLGDDPRWARLADEHGATLRDVRKPPEDPRVADGRVHDLDVPRVTVMGTDCAIGKRTTATALVQEARDRGIDAALLATGQTGIMIGADEGVVVDRLPSDFCAGEVERRLERLEDRDLVIVEGQASVLHPAYSAPSLGILHGSAPHAVVMVHDPTRDHRILFEHEDYTMPPLTEEIDLVERLGTGPVAAIAVNGSEAADVDAAQEQLASETGLPAIDPVARDPGPLLDALLEQVAVEADAPVPAATPTQGS